MIDQKGIFAQIGDKKRIWVIGFPGGDAVRLRFLHKKISTDFSVGDAVVYLGNLMGSGPDSVKTVDEALLFRRAVISIPGVSQYDVIFLRGQQEEMWSKLMQIQFSQEPLEVYKWMLTRGLRQILQSYEVDPDEGLRIIPQGVVAISRWVSALRAAQAAHDGHIDYMGALKHAAYTADESVLFVHRGLRHEVSLNLQGDAFWWGGSLPFVRPYPYHQFKRVIRGFPSASQTGVINEPYYTTIASGGGYDGPVFAILLDETHAVSTVLDA